MTASVYVLRNHTLETLTEPLVRAAATQGMDVVTGYSGYDSYTQEALDPASPLRRRSHDLVVLSLWLDGCALAWTADGRLDPTAALRHVEETLTLVRAATSAPVMVTTHPPPFTRVGTLDDTALTELNAALRALPGRFAGVQVLDVAAMVGALGEERALDSRFWFMYRAPYRADLLGAMATALVSAITLAQGRMRKLLVLDCDETLWGGVVGEDGLQGIALDPDGYPGNVYHAFQRQVVALGRAGVMLALASKNNERDVLEVLDRHPKCVLKREHLAGWEIGWGTKVAALKALAARLNVGLDSVVFVDDSPVECASVREALPTVEVLQVPARRHELPRLLATHRGFSPGGTAEDRARAESYQTERARTEEASRYTSVDDFLASLALRVEVGQARPDDMARVGQLMQRTNQFNLTTRRHTEGDLRAAVCRDDTLVLTVRVSDRFGDYGLTGAAVLQRDGDQCRIDSLLLSCRVLGRRVEDVVLSEIVAAATARWHPRTVVGEYIPTARNAQTQGFYPARGFTLVPGSDGGMQGAAARYVLPSSSEVPAPPGFIDVIRRYGPWTIESSR